MHVQFRPYQDASIEAVKNKWRQGKKKVVVTLPTGGGKTYVFAGIAKLVEKKQRRTIVLVDRKELLKQAGRSIEKLGVEVSYITSDNSKNGKLPVPSYCYVAMQETLWRRVNKYPNFLERLGGIDLVVMDEVHGGHFRRLVKLFGDKFILGFSATPKTSSTKEPLKEYFDDIVCEAQIEELIANGYLNDAKTYGVKLDLSGLRFDKRTHEFSDESMSQVFGSNPSVNSVVNNYKKLANDTKAICYCAGIQHSIQMAAAFELSGVSARHLDGTTPDDERAQILEDFKHGEFLVLCNAMVLTTGYDEPSVQTIILAKATASVVSYMQMCGRGSRLCAEAGKDHFKILDFGNNWKRHGLWQSPYNWVDEFHNPRMDEPDEDAPTKSCLSCGAIMPIGTSKCKECGTPFPVQAKIAEPKEEVEVSLKEIQAAEKQKKLDTLPNDLVGLRFFDMTEDQLKRYAFHMGYKPGWVYYIVKSRVGAIMARTADPKSRHYQLPKQPISYQTQYTSHGVSADDIY